MKTLAIDYGAKRIGIAISDPLGALATPQEALVGLKDKHAAAAIRQLVQETQSEKVLLGLPRNMDGSYGEAADKVRSFGELLSAKLSVPVELIDERLTTVQASRLLHEQGVNAKKQRSRIDSASAAVLLQAYLDANQGGFDALELSEPDEA